MGDEFDGLNLFAMAELSQLRTQALDLLDRCLAENNPTPIIGFIERQVSSNPPQVMLLRDLAEGLQQRLLSLRSAHFDVRYNVVKVFADEYGIDITHFAPANKIDQYHTLKSSEIMERVTQNLNTALATEDMLLLGKLLDVSIKTAGRLNIEIQLTTTLETLVNDWLKALNATVSRRNWSENASDSSVH